MTSEQFANGLAELIIKKDKEIEQLRKALKEYGGHKPDCNSLISYPINTYGVEILTIEEENEDENDLTRKSNIDANTKWKRRLNENRTCTCGFEQALKGGQ